jgi:hypothetical protein
MPPLGKGTPVSDRADSSSWTDASNTQYALLGLTAGAHCGIPVPAKTWSDSLELLLSWQAEAGPAVELRGNEVRGGVRLEWSEAARARGFGYREADEKSGTGSMTTAGAAGLILCENSLWGTPALSPEFEIRTHDGIRDALAWMQAHFSVTQNPGRSSYFMSYYLYGLERMGVLARARFLGTHDWYQEGGALLVREQEKDGLWGDALDTSFSLLFLRRASFHLARPAITPTEPPGPSSATPGK